MGMQITCVTSYHAHIARNQVSKRKSNCKQNVQKN